MREARRLTTNNPQSRTTAKGDYALDLVELERCVFHELLPTSRSINSDIYCDKLDKLSAAIHQRHPELAKRKKNDFHHDNTHYFADTRILNNKIKFSLLTFQASCNLANTVILKRFCDIYI